jgi:hypothetical protein
MTDSPPLTPKAIRKLRRRIENDVYAKEARFWANPKTAVRMGYDKPVNRQAARELVHKPRRKKRPPN